MYSRIIENIAHISGPLKDARFIFSSCEDIVIEYLTEIICSPTNSYHILYMLTKPQTRAL